MAIPKSTKKRKVKLARRKVKGLQAPSFEGWEKLDGAEFHRLKRNVNDFYYMNYKHTDNIEHCFTWMRHIQLAVVTPRTPCNPAPVAHARRCRIARQFGQFQTRLEAILIRH